MSGNKSQTSAPAPEIVLSVQDLCIEFHTDDGIVQAVNHLSFDLLAGETLAIVGESGSGKSVASMSLLDLIPRPPGRITQGKALYRNEDLLQLPKQRMTDIRGRKIAMIFQDPMTSLNPFLTIEEQMTEITRRHLGHSPQEARDYASEMLSQVGIPQPAARLRDYPHQFSGGMRQRVMIAIALSCKPDVLIADEPTTALDVTIQAQILELMQELQESLGMSIVLITHDLGIVAKAAHRVMVMYCGRIVERAHVDELFAAPHHPYTIGLLNSVPRWDDQSERLQAIEGSPPDLAQLPAGCAFADRCNHRLDSCQTQLPPLAFVGEKHEAACPVEFARPDSRGSHD